MDELPVVPEKTAEFTRHLGPQPDEILEEMDVYAKREGFPTVGPEVGSWLQLLARMVDADRIFEFGSGFGYSAYWFARALSDDGEIILTEIDADELDKAREFLSRGGYDSRAVYELGDAIETVKNYDGPFDVVLIDNEKHRYREAFEAVRETVAPGGIVVADNVLTAGDIVDFEALSALVSGADRPDTNEHTRGVANYLERIDQDPDFETGIIPLGEGIAVSHRAE